MIPAFVFHSIIVKFILSKGEGSQSFHRQNIGQPFEEEIHHSPPDRYRDTIYNL